MRRHHKAPGTISIVPRRMKLPFRSVSRYWFNREPVQTHLLNALSLTFPDGERFFVDSVRAFRHAATDPELQRAISGFIGQEAMHSLEHAEFNRMLEAQGYRQQVADGQALARRFIAGGRKHLSPVEQLAVTAALEHITAIMAQWLLHNETILAQTDPQARALWLWHAIEETEHKAVAFDLLQEVTGGDYLTRVRVMAPATWLLLVYTSIYTLAFLRQDRLHQRPLTLARGLWQLARPGGLLSSMVPAWCRYFKPGFHPWEDDDSERIDHWYATLEQTLALNQAA
ncbi:MAG: metal-dependent hydrolase [Pseudomonadota bacterium]|nr:hypothetical protein [Pseudomonadales bacterium]MDY6920317.1 metal-dependent hydrolase [Pseudomonadota bacterium]